MKPITVTQLNNYIAQKLKSDMNLSKIALTGEISGYRYKAGKNIYFDLIDSNSKVSCSIWRSQRSKINEECIKNGNQVNVICGIYPFSKSGSYTFSIYYIEEAGKGIVNEEFEKLKAKLSSEGLFDEKFKKPIPSFPGCVGVITAANGAAVEDIKKTIIAKNNYTDILIFDTLVQGSSATKSICKAIISANRYNDTTNGRKIDTLIVGRGGGSAEDLSCFNDEEVARTIFSSKIPIISAVGHETDFSISDFVADVRAKTPTAAADMAVMDTYELAKNIKDYKNRLKENIKSKVVSEKKLLSGSINLLYSGMKSNLQVARAAIDKAEVYLNENNPLNILSKGYSLVVGKDNKVISAINDVVIDEKYKIMLQDGEFDVKAISKKNNTIG